MSDPVIGVGKDGYYHPTSTAEVAALVRACHAERRKLRVVGAGLGERDAILPGLIPPGAAGGGRPPAGVTMLMLDRMRAIAFDLDHPKGPRVTAEGGANIGRDPYLASGESRWDNSLGWQILQRGYALPDFAAVSHHTIAALVSSGSCGGSAQHSFLDALVGLELVDGTGRVVTLERDPNHPDDDFWAAGVSMGLLGVITKVTLALTPTFNVVGRELRKPIDATPVDFFGEDPRKVTFSRFLRETPYCRMVWWPQRRFEYVALWEMAQVDATPILDPVPYKLLEPDTRGNSVLAAALLTVLGNLDDLSVVPGKLRQWREKLVEELRDEPDQNPCKRPDARAVTEQNVLDSLEQALHKLPFDLGLPAQLARRFGPGAERAWNGVATRAIVGFVGQAMRGLGPLARLPVGRPLRHLLATNIASIVSMFVKDGDSRFQDCWMCGFAIDDQLDARLWPLRFMELAIPLDRVEEMMRVLRRYYRAGGDADLAYRRTGPFACQVYPGKRNDFWLSSSYQRDTARFDGFWFGTNGGDPRDDFFRGLWEEIEPFGFAPHWGKVLPSPGRRWAKTYEATLPKLPAFRALRRRYDPRAVFLTDYWAEHLGIRDDEKDEATT